MANSEKLNNITGVAGNIIGGIQAAKALFQNTGKEEERQDERQIKMQGKLNEINSKTNKELADYEQSLKMQMWKDTNYSAQLEQAGMAGLSKVAVLGGSGGGAQGASVNASGIGSGASGSAQTMMAKTQAELAKAQTANLNANTMKTSAETKKISGVDTKKGEAETVNLGLKNKFQEIENRIKGLTEEDAIEYIKDQSEKMMFDKQIAGGNATEEEETRTARIQTVRREAIGAMIKNSAMKQSIELDQAKIDDIASQINTRIEQIKVSQKGNELQNKAIEEYTKAMLIGAGLNAGASLIKGVMSMKSGKGGSTTNGWSEKNGEWSTETTYK